MTKIEGVQIADQDGNYAKVDRYNKALVLMDWDHHAIHEGKMFSLSVYATVNAGLTSYWQFKTGSKYVHLKEKMVIDGPTSFLISFIESPTVTDGTIEESVFNKNRSSSILPIMKIYNNPSNISGGSTIDIDYLYGNAQGNFSTSPAAIHNRQEWILKPNTSYIFKVENLGEENANILGRVIFYEQ